MGEKEHVTTVYEFGGVLGTTAMLCSLPLTVYSINSICNKEECTLLKLPTFPSEFHDYFDLRTTIILFTWLVLVLVLSRLPLGELVEGSLLRTGQRNLYRCNGIHTLGVAVLLFAGLVLVGVKVTYVYEHFTHLLTSATIFSVVFSVALYARSHRRLNDIRELAIGGNSGWLPYDLFMGRELNPRIFGFDLKFLCELRPGLIGWVLLDLIFVVKAYEINRVSLALIVVVLFHFCYVLDALYFESSVLTQMDITTDGFGFMLVFGDLVWVPFLYSLTARYLLEHPVYWPNQMLLAFVLLNVIGYKMFRGANSQKNNFRNNPDDSRVKHLKTLQTERGTKLLVSGWWGMSRHPNYCGDLIMSIAWSLPCGFNALLPYFYPVYFFILLVHRGLRDDSHCRVKYGKDWCTYCGLVPYRIIPYVF